MSDDREQRDELERLQGEVKRLRAALTAPDGLHADVRARIDQLQRNATQQRERLAEAKREVAALEGELAKVMAENEDLQVELAQVAAQEKQLVDAAVARLDPGPRAPVGCFTVLAVLALVAGVLW